MTYFLDLRLAPVGGDLSPHVAINEGTTIADYIGITAGTLGVAVSGQDVLIGVHGFNVSRASGIAALSNWAALLQLPAGSIFVGVLWPGDSSWAHGLDYPGETPLASHAGGVLAPFLDSAFASAASISFASHSLGARVVLSTVSLMQRPVRRTMLMAGAIEDDCFNDEFKDAAVRIDELSVLASTKDEVLSVLFPAGNFLAKLLEFRNPFSDSALGSKGPASPWPDNFRAPFQIPDRWEFGHGDYLRIAVGQVAVLPLPVSVPQQGANSPGGAPADWQAEWTAAVESTRFR